MSTDWLATLMSSFTLACWTQICCAFANSVDPDQLASGSVLFVIQYVNVYQQPGSSNMIGWHLEVDSHGILIYSAWQGLTIVVWRP